MNHRLTGQLPVALQFALIAAVAVRAARPFLAGLAGTGPWRLMVSVLALRKWALTCNRPGNFNIHPAP